MTDKKISELVSITGADVDDTADELAIVDGSLSETKRITREELFKGIDGNVGIGTSSPAHQLEVENSTGNAIIAATSSTTGTSQLRLGDTANTAAGRIEYDNSTNTMSFFVGGSEKLVIDTSGDAEINGLTVGLGGGSVSTNTVFGSNALLSNTTGASHTAIGINALRANTTGDSNTSVGFNSLFSNTTGSFNTAVGRNALNANVTGSSNSAFGNGALQNNTANSNTAVGVSAANATTTGSGNAAVGNNALQDNTTGTNNTAIGTNAINNVTTGANNTALGSGSGTTLTTGSRNIIVGASSQPSAAAGSDQVVVGYNITGKGNDTAFIGGTNGAYNEKNVTTWETTSDERIKKNITDNNDGLAVLSQIQVRNFEYRTPDEITDLPSHAAIEQEGVQLGVIAQELQQVLPECVNENSTGVLSVSTDPLIWYLINAVKELNAEIAQLKGE